MTEPGKSIPLGIPKETFPQEQRVAVVPDQVPSFIKAGFQPIIQAGAGEAAGYADSAYTDKGATIAPDREAIFRDANVILQVRGIGANPEAGRAELELIRPGQVLVGHYDPLSSPELAKEVAARKATVFAIELLPRITRAQSMDALSSMATVGGYKAVLLAAAELPLMFPMLMTAAGTVSPAHVLVIGAGVAGLQAIATAKRLGAVVQAYDVRPAVKEQVESLGAKFVEMELEAGEAEDKGGYAKELGEEFYRKQRELMLKVVKTCNVVITTAAIPGKKAPILITEDMVKAMPLGSIIVDMAAERGGNCELTEVGKTITKHGTKILGPVNLPATIPYHASQMYCRNLLTFVRTLVKEGNIVIDREDEVIRDTLLAADGDLVNPRVRELAGLPAISPERSAD